MDPRPPQLQAVQMKTPVSNMLAHVHSTCAHRHNPGELVRRTDAAIYGQEKPYTLPETVTLGFAPGWVLQGAPAKSAFVGSPAGP